VSTDAAEQPVPPPAAEVTHFLAWSRLWSPLLDDRWREEAWQQLGLDGDFNANRGDFLRCFHVALPQPPAALLMHAALDLDGGTVREEFVRIMEYLELDYDDAGRLPPDHLACVCELYALALHLDEPVLVEGLRERYLLPWVQRAAPAVAALPVMAALVARFGEDLAAN